MMNNGLQRASAGTMDPSREVYMAHEQVADAGGAQRGESRVGMLVAGRYRIKSVIARGAMGVVYVADQMPLNRQVALKVLDQPLEGEDSERVQKRFFREASTLARLEHPNTVRIYDFGVWENVPFIAMELVEGFSLRRLQGNGAIPAVRAIDIGLQICSALREAHAMGLVHRDLKPANILITRHAGQLDFVKVVDFGLAKGFYGGDQDLTQAGQVLGTPMYMSPEQIRDESCEPRSDIYSLGVVLYRSLTGETPFAKGSTAEVLMANLYDKPRPFREVAPDLDIPPAVEWVVMRCLEKKLGDRFANVVELQKALKAVRRAVEDPTKRWMSISFDAGHAIIPEDVTESSHSSLSVSRISRAAPSAEAASRFQLRLGPLGAIPDWMVMVALACMVVLGVAAGVMAERALSGMQDAAPSPPPAMVVPAAAADGG
jgi:serine/threonine-protein kinase